MACADSDKSAAKADLRAKLRFRRDQFARNLPDFVQAIAFRAPPAPLRTLLTSQPIVGGYAAGAHEAPVDALLTIAADAGVAVALPFFRARDADMRFARWHPGTPLEAGPWRVMQPVDRTEPIIPALLLCPLLGFDRHGGRIGQGGGHYDRFLAAHPDCFRIGIAWSVQEVDRVPREPHDASLDAVLTEQEWIVTGERL